MLKQHLKIHGIIITVFLLPLISFAQVSEVVCLKSGYTVATINGIFTKEGILGGTDGAEGNRKAVANLVPPIYRGELLTVRYIYNPTHGVLDLSDIAIQKTFESVNERDPDLIRMLSDASNQIKTQKVLLVAHSQGNLYANSIYGVVTKNGDVSRTSIGVYGVASPANRVAGDGIYRTSDTDTVINNARKFLPGSVLSTNDSIDYLDSDDSGKGHAFREVYLRYRGEDIKKEIEASLGKLVTVLGKPENVPCISIPKELSLSEKVINPMVYSVDFALSATLIGGNVAKTIAKVVYRTTVAVASTVHDVVTSLLSNEPALANNNMAASVILAVAPPLTESVPQQQSTTPTPTSSEPQDMVAVAPLVNTVPEEQPVVDDTPIVVQNNEVQIPAEPLTQIEPTPAILVFGSSTPTPISEPANNNGADTSSSATSTEVSMPVLPLADTTPPIITIQGSNPATMVAGVLYIDAGATATDDVDGIRTIDTTSNVNPAIAGTYTVTYIASDLSNNIATSTRVVQVVADASEPLVTMLSSDLNTNGIPDADENEVIASSTKSLPAGEYHFHNLIITNNATLVAGGDISSTSSFKGVKIVADNITVTTGSAISADGQGYSSTGPGAGAGSVAASYGGLGGGNTEVSRYGSAVKPIDLGSGVDSNRGGGAIRLLVTGALLNDGRISANGSGDRSSGGSIYVNTNNFAGIGAFETKGGNTSWPNQYAGGGGRIAVHYKQSSFLGTAKATSGVYCFYGCNPAGGQGTVAFFDTTNNDLYPKSYFRFQANDGPFNVRNISFVSGATADTENGATITAENISLQSVSYFTINNNATIKSQGLSVTQGSTVLLGDASVDIDSVVVGGSGSTLTLSRSESLTVGTLDIQNGGTLTTTNEKILSLIVSNLTVASGASISANSKGHPANTGTGSAGVGTIGASYGGVGHLNTASSTYGSSTAPIDFGSGGGNAHTSGGGAIRIIATETLENNGSISANGDYSSSGGSIYVTANVLLGSGAFFAKGGNLSSMYGYFAPPGGGGRVAVYYQNSSFEGAAEALGGCGSYDGFSSVCAGEGTTIVEQLVDTPPVPVVLPEPTPPAATSTPALSSERSITSFEVLVASSTISGIIDETNYAVTFTVPFGTDIQTLTPFIGVSAFASSTPVSGVSQDFTNPVIYTVTAEDGSTQEYTVTLSVDPDTTPPTITTYTFNDIAGDITADFATTTPTVTFVLTASENVDWVSLKIEDQNDPTNYKTFFSGVGCIDGTATCTKTWDGSLSAGVSATTTRPYRIKVHMKDRVGNPFQDYLSPYLITVDAAVAG